MLVNRISVAGGRGKETRISVSDWPEPDAVWRVGTSDQRGRRLTVVGYHRFTKDIAVGSLTLHVEDRKPLMISNYELADSLVDGERSEALAAMVLCAEGIALELREIKIGNGSVRWQVDHKRAEVVHRLFPAYRPDRRRLRGRRKGASYFTKKPD